MNYKHYKNACDIVVETEVVPKSVVLEGYFYDNEDITDDVHCFYIKVCGQKLNSLMDLWNFFRPLLYKDNGREYGEFFTCSCGISGCAGYGHTTVKYKKNVVSWDVSSSDGFKGALDDGVSSDLVYFKRDQYEKVGQDIINMIKKDPKRFYSLSPNAASTGYYILSLLKEYDLV